jgi:competence ComEA-like helix-hairpin-helix protein
MDRGTMQDEMAQDSPATGGQPPREPWGWNRRQRIGLGMLLGILCIFLALQWWQRPARKDGPVVVAGQPLTLPQRVDPNTAPEEQLLRIPHVGRATAQKIIAYREAHRSGGPAFKRLEDLDAVPSIGKSLLEQLEPYLEFPEPAP